MLIPSSLQELSKNITACQIDILLFIRNNPQKQQKAHNRAFVGVYPYLPKIVISIKNEFLA